MEDNQEMETNRQKMKRCLYCKQPNKTGGEWCSIKCEEAHQAAANQYQFGWIDGVDY
jgi:hypothetical protein